MYQAVVNQEVKMEVSLNEAGYLVDGTPFNPDRRTKLPCHQRQ
jgi:hypothetical protein